MSYLQYFGLDSEPFGHAPSSRFYYASAEHTQALRRLLHCVQSMQGLAVLVGDMGRGKTTLARRLLEALPEAEYAAALVVIVHREIAPLWLIKHIAGQLGVVEPADSAPEVLGQLYTQLMVLHQSGRRAVVLIDEAQMLETRALMEEFRGLLNLEVPGHKLISFVFFGLPSIEDALRLDPPLAQRVALRYALQPLSGDACTAYINHRLEVVGARWQMFSPGALEAIYQFSQGVPRVINTLCDNLMLEMFLAGGQVAEREHAVAVAQNLNLIAGADAAPPPSAPWERGVADASDVPPPGVSPLEPPVLLEYHPDLQQDLPRPLAAPPATPHDAGAHLPVFEFAVEPEYTPTPAPLSPGAVEASPQPPVPAWSMPQEATAQPWIEDAPSPLTEAPPAMPPSLLAPESAPLKQTLPDPAAEDWSGLLAVGSLLTNADNASPSTSDASPAALPLAAPVDESFIGVAAPDDLGPEDQAAHTELASTSYGTLDLDEVTALLAQIRRS